MLYKEFHILLQIYTANHAIFPVQIYAITVKICSKIQVFPTIKAEYVIDKYFLLKTFSQIKFPVARGHLPAQHL